MKTEIYQIKVKKYIYIIIKLNRRRDKNNNIKRKKYNKIRVLMK